MRLVSPILERLVYPTMGRLGFHWHASRLLRVVTYHGVLPEGYRRADLFLDNTLVSIASFRSQLRLLKKRYNVISPACFLRCLRKLEELPDRSVLLTCDDGLLNNLTTMLPVLEEEGLQCLFFVTGNSLADVPDMLWYVELYLMLLEVRGDHEPIDWRGTLISAVPAGRKERLDCWLRLLGILSRIDSAGRADFLREGARCWGLDPIWKRRYLDDELLRQRFQVLGSLEVRLLADAGMTIGAHTVSHPALSEQSARLAYTEISDCRSMLQSCLGQPVWAIAYPFGDAASVGEREYQFARTAGYECAFVNEGGCADIESSTFSLPRIHVTAAMTLPVYEAHVSGFHNSLQRSFRRPRLKSTEAKRVRDGGHQP